MQLTYNFTLYQKTFYKVYFTKKERKYKNFICAELKKYISKFVN